MFHFKKLCGDILLTPPNVSFSHALFLPHFALFIIPVKMKHCNISIFSNTCKSY